MASSFAMPISHYNIRAYIVKTRELANSRCFFVATSRVIGLLHRAVSAYRIRSSGATAYEIRINFRRMRLSIMVGLSLNSYRELGW
jgi:hypothetical protein